MTPPIPGPEEGLNAAVAARLRAERAAAGMTIDELAAAAGLTEISLRRYLKAQRHIDVAVLASLAAVLGKSAREIVGEAIDYMERQGEREQLEVDSSDVNLPSVAKRAARKPRKD